MRTITIPVSDQAHGYIGLGKQGENRATRVVFYVKTWLDEYPDAQFALYIAPPGENVPYLAKIERDMDAVVWTVGLEDTASAGSGTAELIMSDGETTIKSKTLVFMVKESISSGVPGAAPQAKPAWWQEIERDIQTLKKETVKTVNGVKPDKNGNVNVAGGEGGAAQLIGTTETVTPLEVAQAIQSGMGVLISHAYAGFGTIISGDFAYMKDAGIVLCSSVAYYNNMVGVCQLIGNVENGKWEEFNGELALKRELPTKLPNPQRLTIRDAGGSTIATYDGSLGVDLTLPSSTGGGSAKPWLKGTTSEITPAQVGAAITENDQSVMIYHEVDEYGMVGFSNFVVSVDGNGVAASVVFKMGGDEGVPVYYTLIGMAESGTWTVAAGVIADAQIVAKELDGMDQAIARMRQDKADRAYMVQLFEELKALILAGDTGGAVALLDQAILDQAVLA